MHQLLVSPVVRGLDLVGIRRPSELVGRRSSEGVVVRTVQRFGGQQGLVGTGVRKASGSQFKNGLEGGPLQNHSRYSNVTTKGAKRAGRSKRITRLTDTHIYELFYFLLDWGKYIREFANSLNIITADFSNLSRSVGICVAEFTELSPREGWPSLRIHVCTPTSLQACTSPPYTFFTKTSNVQVKTQDIPIKSRFGLK